MNARDIVKLFKDESEWGSELKTKSRVVGNDLEIVDTYWAGGERALKSLIDEWTKPTGSYYKYFKNEHNTTFSLVDSFIDRTPRDVHKKISKTLGIVGVILKVN